MNQENKLFDAYCFIQHMAQLTMEGATHDERTAKLRANWASGAIRALFPPRVSLIMELKPREARRFVQAWKIDDNDYHQRLTCVVKELGGWPAYASNGELIVDAFTEAEKVQLAITPTLKEIQMTNHYSDSISRYRDERVESLEFQQKFREERIKRICEKYDCTQEDACRFIDYREEGYSVHQSAVMAGIADPIS